MFLLCCFALGVIVKHCDDEVETCQRFIGMDFNSYRASITVIFFTAGMLVITGLLMAFLFYNAITQPKILLNETKSVPNLEIAESCNYHAFISHVWSTGQAKTHAIVRKMQLLVPGMVLFLDVDKLDNIDHLEQYICESAVFILYYSEGYFRSENCRRELFAAFESKKPAFVIYEGSIETIEKMKDECKSNCQQTPFFPSSSEIIPFLLDNGAPIRWHDAAVFSASSLKMIMHRLLSNLPYYIKDPRLLDKGLTVPEEILYVRVQHSVQVVVCEHNDGAREVVKKAIDLLPDCAKSLISIQDANEFFSRMNLKDSSRTVFFLYLNQHTFLCNEETHNLVHSALMDNRIDDILLAHETDLTKAGCTFREVCRTTPQSLLDPPCKLYSNIAVPLHDTEEDRTVSLRLLLTKLVGNPQRQSSSSSPLSYLSRKAIDDSSIKQIQRKSSRYNYYFDN